MCDSRLSAVIVVMSRERGEGVGVGVGLYEREVTSDMHKPLAKSRWLPWVSRLRQGEGRDEN